ncbi:unnamed protein product [Macrosiphum euphorbiae]|uniref:Uncharacterized protein n=1 Tax=Macrosiphum euphorbiae TaxID=13131 RepID=A0AAV0XUJ9_9HEMI|nr:unnamed protein product [Macrosiphum euphorbiae]
MSDHWHIRHINLSSELFKMKLIDEDEDDMFEAIHNNVDKMVKFPFHSVPDVNLNDETGNQMLNEVIKQYVIVCKLKLLFTFNERFNYNL